MAWIERREGVKKTSYRVHYRDRFTGKKRNKSFPRRKDAQAFLETVGSRENLVTHSDPNVTVSETLERWYHLCTTSGRNGRPPVERSTHEKYAHHQTIISEMIGHKKLSDLSKRDCNDLRDQLLERYSRPYAKKFLTSFKSALNQAVSDEVIQRSPAHDTTILISKRIAMAERVSIPSMEEIRRLTGAIDDLMNHPNGQKRQAWARYGTFFYTMLYTGMRPGEMRGLAWSNIDWNASRIMVDRRADAYGVLGPLKSASAYRTISVTDAVIEKLKAWRMKCPKSLDDLVFPNFQGNVESLRNITSRGWYVLCEAAGLSDADDAGKPHARYNLYALRHTKASLEIALKRSPKRIQTIMGHANIQMTFDTYGHLFEDESLQDDPNDLEKLIQMGAKQVPEKNQVTELA